MTAPYQVYLDGELLDFRTVVCADEQKGIVEVFVTYTDDQGKSWAQTDSQGVPLVATRCGDVMVVPTNRILH